MAGAGASACQPAMAGEESDGWDANGLSQGILLASGHASKGFRARRTEIRMARRLASHQFEIAPVYVHR